MTPNLTPEEIAVAIAVIQTDIAHIKDSLDEVVRDHEARLRKIENSDRTWKWGQGIFTTVMAAIAAVIGYQK